MALAGLCISRSGLDITLISSKDGQVQSMEHHDIQNLDPVDPITDSLVRPVGSLSQKYPREITVLAVSPQMSAQNKYRILPKIDFTTDDRFTVNYIDAYIGGSQIAKGVSLLFIEATPTIFNAQIVTTTIQGSKRAAFPLYAEARSSTVPLAEFVGQAFSWSQPRKCNISQCVLLDLHPENLNLSAIKQVLNPDCTVVTITGADLAQHAARYAFIDLQELRQEEDDDGLGIYVAGAPIWFSVNKGPARQLIWHKEVLPETRAVPFTLTDTSKTDVTVEFALGDHQGYPHEKFIFAKITLDRVSKGNSEDEQLQAFAFVSMGWGNCVEVFQGAERHTAKIKATLQLPQLLSIGRAYNAFKATES
ncbi:hypothetical protein CPB83DRAFT_195476 [Crepidotus variabilis]|uniref:Uncharacterized protein n=1 Tax=Crepidotus variabilis TaxID=179855 RepID=A0A9P6JR71_9AGAR|nr:hypothetical protein CPB83DRAFT_195476 [Crepidotus variabilis]